MKIYDPNLDDYAKIFADPLQEGAINPFANNYLALRVFFFNELDTYAEMKGLDTTAIINGVGLDNL